MYRQKFAESRYDFAGRGSYCRRSATILPCTHCSCRARRLDTVCDREHYNVHITNEASRPSVLLLIRIWPQLAILQLRTWRCKSALFSTTPPCSSLGAVVTRTADYCCTHQTTSTRTRRTHHAVTSHAIGVLFLFVFV